MDRELDADPAAVEAVIDVVRQSTPCVILDLPHQWNPWVRQTLLASDEIVIVATPDLPSVRMAKALADIVKQNRPNDPPPKLVMNQVGVPKRPEIPVKDFGSTVGLTPAIVFPFEPQLYGAAANNGQTLIELQPKSATAEAVMRLAQIVTGRAAPAEEKSVSPFLSILTGRKQA
jgi:pilus assembly protein CpaE